MSSRRIGFALLFVLLWFPIGSRAEDSAPPTPLSVAEKLVEAFNRHDPEAMAALVTDDFELFYIDDNGAAGLATSGPAQLLQEMKGYFAARPNVRSEIVDAVDGPVFVSFREQIVGGQSSLAVYEVRDGRIGRVWYFPAEGPIPDPRE